MTQNYLIANVHVQKVVHKEIPSGTSYGRSTEPKITERTVGEVTRLVIRAETMEELREKLTGHMALVDDKVVGEDEPSKITR